MLLPTKSSMFLLDVLMGQPIKLVKIVCTQIIGSYAFHWCNFHSCEVSKISWNIFLMQMLCTNSSSHGFSHIILSLMTKNSCVFVLCGLKTSWTGCQNGLNIYNIVYFSFRKRTLHYVSPSWDLQISLHSSPI